MKNRNETYLEITHGNDNSVFIMNETEMMTRFDNMDYWQKKRYEELIVNYVKISGKNHAYYIRGSVLYGLDDRGKIEKAKKWAIWYDKHKLPKYSLLD